MICRSAHDTKRTCSKRLQAGGACAAGQPAEKQADEDAQRC